MFPISSDIVREQKGRAYAIAREMTGESVPHLDLGKKVSLPQDLMMEELSLHRNRGSCMYLERQKRVQRFIFEYPSNQINAGSNVCASRPDQTAPGEMSGKGGLHGKENDHPEIYTVPGGCKTPPVVPKKTAKVLQMKMSLNPDVIAPGYSGPLKEVPFERFNSTAIPKSYRSPWMEDQNTEYITSINEVHPEAMGTAVNDTYRSYNRTPVPFGSLSVVDGSMTPNLFEELQEPIEGSTSGLEIMSQRPSFNRAPRGWTMKYMPESEDL